MQPQAFSINIADSAIADLQHRIRNTRWPQDLDNDNWQYGFNGNYLRDLANSWINDYSWREAEREMNRFQHYRTRVDGVPIHYIHQAGAGPKPMPLLINHGWPSSFLEMQKVIEPLANPAAFGGNAEDAFDVYVVSLPGFGFSTPLPEAAMNSARVSELLHKLMTETLGYERFAVSGGDWGSRMASQLGHAHADSLYGVHILGSTPLDLFNHERYWDITASFVPYDAPENIRKAILPFVTKAIAHSSVQSLEPQTLAYAMHDSPIGQLAWLVQRLRDWGHTNGDVETMFNRDYLLTKASLYWFSECFVSSVRYYRDAVLHPWQPAHNRSPRIEAPTGITFLGGENPPGVTTENRVELFKQSPRAADYNLQFVNAHDAGGHFGYYENPEACIHDIRATFRALR